LYKSNIEKHRIRFQGYGEIDPVNKCKNGVECSEEEHALNRRTELKVVGLLDIDPFKNKTLGEIIEEENFEKMLAEIQNQEQVVITGDEELQAFRIQEEKKERELEAQRIKDSLALVNGVSVEDKEVIAKVNAEETTKEIVEEKEPVIVETEIVKTAPVTVPDPVKPEVNTENVVEEVTPIEVIEEVVATPPEIVKPTI